MGDDRRGGLSRRDLIKRSAVGGVGIWSAPIIFNSLATPAAAGTTAFPTGCSWGLVVFTYQGVDYVVKIDEGDASCYSSNVGNPDGDFDSFVCGGFTYRIVNTGSQPPLERSGDGVTYSVIPAYTGTCSDLFDVSGSTFTALDPTVQIRFGVTHHGPPHVQGTIVKSKMWPTCGSGGTSITLDCKQDTTSGTTTTTSGATTTTTEKPKKHK
jgi:hypothetical protein